MLQGLHKNVLSLYIWLGFDLLTLRRNKTHWFILGQEESFHAGDVLCVKHLYLRCSTHMPTAKINEHVPCDIY